MFSVVTIALSYKAISKNKTNSELKNEMKAQEQTISGQKTQLAKKEAEVKAQEEENSKLKDQVRTQKQKSSEQKTQLAEKNKKIEEDKLKVAIADGTVQLAKGTVIALFTIIRTDRNMLLACYSHKHISYRIRTIIRKAIIALFGLQKKQLMVSCILANMLTIIMCHQLSLQKEHLVVLEVA